MRAIGLTLAGLLALLPALEAPAASGAATAMTAAAEGLLTGLSDEQRARAVFPFDDAERTNWHFIPRERRGLPLEAMSPPQRELARALLQTGLSAEGLATAETVMSLERVLFDLGSNPASRNAERYYFSVFGEPRADRPWGWRVEGHHLSLNFTVVESAPVAWAPAFFGANPAEVRSGPRAGLRALPREEDLARALVSSLGREQREAAIVSAEAPPDILSEVRPEAAPLTPSGLAAARLSAVQREQLAALLEVYLGKMDAALAATRRAAIDEAGFDAVSFAWAGPEQPGAPHYYRIQGPSFLVEYDNTQDGANHVHTVWRDFDGDFGRDVLREHYAGAHADGGHGHGHRHGGEATSR
jgi:hypothetical protein